MPITKIAGKKKDGLQAYRVRVNYTDQNGNHKRIERYAYGMAEAKETELKLEQEAKELASGTVKPDVKAPPTVGDLFEEYKAYKIHEVRETTYEKAVRELDLHIIPMFRDHDVASLDVHDIMKWRMHINSMGFSLVYRNNLYSTFRTLLNFAKKMKYISSNPVTELGRFVDSNIIVDHEELHFYTPEEFLRFIPHLKANATTVRKNGLYVFFCIAYYTGMRKSEIHALKWSDITKSEIKIRRAISQKVKGKKVAEYSTKNRSSFRTIQIPEPLSLVLNEHKTMQQSSELWTPDFRICGGDRPLSDTSIANANIAAATAAGLPHITIHDFRHSHASLLINEGVNIMEIARRLGHSDVQETWNTYGHLYPRETEKALSILNSVQLPEYVK